MLPRNLNLKYNFRIEKYTDLIKKIVSIIANEWWLTIAFLFEQKIELTEYVCLFCSSFIISFKIKSSEKLQ